MLKTLVEIDTTHAHGSMAAAQAIQHRLLSAGFPAADVDLLAPSGFSDDRQTRNAGMISYDISGVWQDVDENRAHGRDERIGIQAFDESVEFTYRLVKTMSSGK
jgi:acetylornithine deacetylase/succinyl-diaminopimelate desuccinylase-like protein